MHGAAHGFLPDRNVVSNALPHAGAHTVMKLDIKDFFPTITWKRVMGLLRKAGMREQAATLLALLVTEAPRQAVEFRGLRQLLGAQPSGDALIRGKGRYTDDIAPHPALHALMLRSPLS